MRVYVCLALIFLSVSVCAQVPVNFDGAPGKIYEVVVDHDGNFTFRETGTVPLPEPPPNPEPPPQPEPPEPPEPSDFWVAPSGRFFDGVRYDVVRSFNIEGGDLSGLTRIPWRNSLLAVNERTHLVEFTTEGQVLRHIPFVNRGSLDLEAVTVIDDWMGGSLTVGLWDESRRQIVVSSILPTDTVLDFNRALYFDMAHNTEGLAAAPNGNTRIFAFGTKTWFSYQIEPTVLTTYDVRYSRPRVPGANLKTSGAFYDPDIWPHPFQLTRANVCEVNFDERRILSSWTKQGISGKVEGLVVLPNGGMVLCREHGGDDVFVYERVRQ